MKPKCMTDEDYRRWQLWNNRVVTMSEMAQSPCQDCMPDFAREMRAIDMCNGRPGGFAGTIAPHQIASIENRRKAMREAADRAFELYMQGMKQVDVAKTMGLSQSAISKYIRMKRSEMAS